MFLHCAGPGFKSSQAASLFSPFYHACVCKIRDGDSCDAALDHPGLQQIAYSCKHTLF